MAQVSDYTGLITSEHADKPKFTAMVGAIAGCFVDVQNFMQSIPDAFDLDNAVGVQLGSVGLWVGVTRQVKTPLTGVYFSLDVPGLGFDQGVWQGPFDPSTGVTTLDDETYRLLIRARIGANHWDGTLDSSADILSSIFGNPSTQPVNVATNAESFGTGDGSTRTYQLVYQGSPVIAVSAAQIFRNDWQGNQSLYPTARTNLAVQSTNLLSASWTRTRVTSLIAATGPDGSANAATLTAASSGGASYLYQAYNFVAGQSYATFGFAKAGSSNTITIQSFTQPGLCSFTLSGAGSIGTPSGIASNPWIIPLSGGWYMYGCTLTASATGANNVSMIVVPTANASVTFFGPQIGSGGSYIPTGAAAVTLTDYALSSTGLLSLAAAPVAAATLTWTGSGQIYPGGTRAFIQDNEDMSITIGIAGTPPSALFLALLAGGYIPLKPEAVRINYYLVTSTPGAPIFGFDVENSFVSGFDVGTWGVPA